MGFFDRLSGRKGEPAAALTETPATAAAGGVMPQLVAARERLEAKDLPGALAIYEPVLAAAGDRADVLVTVSADLGLNGHLPEIVELVAPRYDAERHGPATGLNLLQAYLALRQADAAQHVLDILFSLQRPELEERLHGFSNAIAELINSDLPPLDSAGGAPEGTEAPRINFVSISKPIWFYGLEPIAAEVLPAKGAKVRRLAFTQLALMGVPDLGAVTQQPETEAGRLTRAIPLWFAETFYFSSHYLPIAVVGVMNEKHYALIGAEWTSTNLGQLAGTTEGGLDYIFTGALREVAGDYEVAVRLWEVKKMKERKLFTARWNAGNADVILTQLHEQVRTFMEWSADPSAISYVPPAHPAAWLGLLGTSLSLFLGGKGLLPPAQLVLPREILEGAAANAAESDSASLAYLTLTRAAVKQGVLAEAGAARLRSTPMVERARQIPG
ncbi:MAG: hypothetical protein JWM88_159 [Verrucomicrobia bacterium]|nr:hypothetical protein [Verrucomicrobiota bacterium]